MTKTHKILVLFIIMQPIIDILTSLSSMYTTFPVSIGAVCRAMMIIVLFFLLLGYFWKTNHRIMLLYIASFAAIFLMVMVNIVFKQNMDWFAEMNFALKTSYYLTMIFVAMVWMDKRISNSILYQASVLVSLIVGGSFWLAIITDTSMHSYAYTEIGYTGWFFAANELSVTIVILLGIMTAKLHHDKQWSSWLGFMLMLSIVPIIGTKTAFWGGMLIVLFYMLYVLWTCKLRIWNDKHSLLLFSIVIIFICFLPLSSNSTRGAEAISNQAQTHVEETQGSHSFLQKLVSSRDLYFQNIKADFSDANGVRKVFGLGYAGDYKDSPKVIEMDFFDLFFSYGIMGSILLLLPLLYVGVQIMKTAFPLHMEKALLLFVISLCFGIGLIAGHVLFAPSVMTYMAILFCLSGVDTYG
ncbi:O-antigen ligase family protein [Virgibacillus sp. NKC19-3]|uniref:O-antigen ligase family protein n=1 Tax=Virgibacillus saliphilus TaxID=2831674 RepID=UPI001C9B8BB1|nr:O-antigen ligase family protein [Virgibacillus sp. NKC19-3]MBY7144642.1 O-antigen ligase family protein [Virgibacillus sp. NKC19-3]